MVAYNVVLRYKFISELTLNSVNCCKSQWVVKLFALLHISVEALDYTNVMTFQNR